VAVVGDGAPVPATWRSTRRRREGCAWARKPRGMRGRSGEGATASWANEAFVAKAPPAVIEQERKRLQSRISGRRPRHPLPARHQGAAQGNAAGGGQAADPVRGGRGLRGRHPPHGLRHRRNKRAIEDHFDTAYELESELEANGKQELLELVRTLAPDDMHCSFVRQPRSLGLGHAVLCAQPIVGDEPFAVLLADDLMTGADGGPGVLTQMVEVRPGETSVLAVQEVPLEHVRRYGIVAGESVGDAWSRSVPWWKSRRPKGAVAPGRGRPLHPHPRRVRPHPQPVARQRRRDPAHRRHRATDRLRRRARLRYEGKRYDCGSKEGFLEATVEFALKHEEVGAASANTCASSSWTEFDPLLPRHDWPGASRKGAAATAASMQTIRSQSSGGMSPRTPPWPGLDSRRRCRRNRFARCGDGAGPAPPAAGSPAPAR
jgi:UTP--glucose-1-phosphate uridylyltransferase